MREKTKALRREKIHQAAYALLAEKGYRGTSMLSIAKRAKASNETLYRWYGGKQGLFEEMVHENARAVSEVIAAHLCADQPLWDSLNAIGPVLLELVTGPRALALNRAAGADVHNSTQLGETISRAGRETVAPLIVEIFARATSTGEAPGIDPVQATELYLTLLIGDLQIRCVIGAIEPPDSEERSARSRQVIDNFRKIYAPHFVGTSVHYPQHI